MGNRSASVRGALRIDPTLDGGGPARLTQVRPRFSRDAAAPNASLEILEYGLAADPPSRFQTARGLTERLRAISPSH